MLEEVGSRNSNPSRRCPSLGSPAGLCRSWCWSSVPLTLDGSALEDSSFTSVSGSVSPLESIADQLPSLQMRFGKANLAIFSPQGKPGPTFKENFTLQDMFILETDESIFLKLLSLDHL